MPESIPTEFERVRQYERVPIRTGTREERRGGFALLEEPYRLEEAVLEAQRCLDCGMPYCVQACPIAQDCRGYIQLIAQRRFDEAARLTLRDDPLSSVLCKTCYHYCEEDCVVGGRGTPIAIRHLKRAALEFGNSDLVYVPSAPKHRRIAVIGAGPTGIMAAWELGLRGYSVSVFESEAILGGQMQTIPKYHLEGDELGWDLARFRKLDITFVVGKRAGTDYSPGSLLEDGYLAVLVCIGASAPRRLGLPGEELPGVFSALPFLLAMNTSPQGLFGRTGRKTVVVGGGDVAMDAARSALRLDGRGDVTVVYRRKKDDMSAGEEEVVGGEVEGIHYLFERAPVRIEGADHVERVVLVPTQLAPPDATGRRRVEMTHGPEEPFECDTVIIAVGETADLTGFSPDLDFTFGRQGWPQGQREGWMTDREGVFATGGRSVVHAMGAGTKVAEAIDAYVSRKLGTKPLPRPDPFGGSSPPKLPEGYGGPTWEF